MLLTVAVSVFGRKRKFEEDIQRMLWKIKMEELSFKTSAESVRSLLLEATIAA